jgi:polyketide cyclase/dehydrase/lipid transport protein
MARAYFSTVLNHTADTVWSVIRPFDHYAWAGVESETAIEAGKSGDQVSAIRRVAVGDRIIRQVLLAHSDRERSYTYAFCDPGALPVRDYTATIRVTPVVETEAAFVEWWAMFDCAVEERDPGCAISNRKVSPNGWRRCASSWRRGSVRHETKSPSPPRWGERAGVRWGCLR